MKNTKRTVKYFTKDLLIKANKFAIKTNRNRTLKPEKLAVLPAEMKFPVVFDMVHNDQEMRVGVVYNENGDVAYLDVTFELYNLLPEAVIKVRPTRKVS